MNRDALSLDDREFLEPYLSKITFRISDFLFSNIFLFRKKHEYTLVKEDVPYILGKTYDNKHFSYLLVNPSKIPKATLTHIISQGEFLYPIPESWKNAFSKNEYTIDFFEGDSDYLFNKSTLSDYPGRNLSKKRNLVHQFHELYNAKLRKCSKSDALQIKDVLDIWVKQTKRKIEETDYYPCLEAIEMQDILQLSGLIVSIDGIDVGFLLGEGKNDTFYIHFAKADMSYKGIFQFMYQEFCKTLSDDIHYINLEQDLGDPNLKHAKHSYHPDKMEIKYRTFRKV